MLAINLCWNSSPSQKKRKLSLKKFKKKILIEIQKLMCDYPKHFSVLICSTLYIGRICGSVCVCVCMCECFEAR